MKTYNLRVSGYATDSMVSYKIFSIITAFSLCHMFPKAQTQQCKGEDSVTGKMLKGFTFKKMKVKNPSECLQVCNDNQDCYSINYVMLEDICELNNSTTEAKPEELKADPRRYFFQVKRLPPPPSESCAAVKEKNKKATDGSYKLKIISTLFLVYYDMTTDGQGWTLVARFSDSDTKAWMMDSGEWWYDKNVAAGETTDPGSNTDMISPAFWLDNGNEFKITRSDDPQHTPLLQTTDDCLGGQTFRSKITSYGNFKNNWHKRYACRGSCPVKYGGQYETTAGFSRAKCNGNLQTANNIGFWCDGGWDGSVMMIGGGGRSCSRGDHGIGITGAKRPGFRDTGRGEHDFGNSAFDQGTVGAYALNLWVR